MAGISSVGGTGSNAIETSYIQMYKSGFMQQFQQFDTKLANYFDIQSQAGEFEYYDRIGLADELVEVNTRYHDNPQSEIAHDRRRLGLRDFEQGKYMEPKDLFRLAEDPSNAYVTALRGAAHRKMDDIVINRIFDVAHVGKKGEASVSFVSSTTDKITVGALSAGNARPITTAGKYALTAGDYEGIDIDCSFDYTTTGTDSGITLDKLKAARFTMERLESVSEDEVLDCWITSDQARQLLAIDEVINSDFATRKALAEGSATTFMNFRFRRSERLLGSGTASDPRQCIVAKKNSMVVGYSKNLTFDMWRDTAKRNIPYMYLFLGMDAVRMWGECTCRINCLDS
jgi:hypothetical protein